MALAPSYQTGATPDVRRALAGLRDRNDKLAALRQLHPDAHPSAEDPDNFVYTDPNTGRLRLVTPKVTSMATIEGDLAAWVPTVSEFGGAAMGALAGAPAIVTGPVGSLVAGASGAFLGGAAGRELATKAALAKAGMTDPRSLPKQVTDIGITGVGNALGEGIGRSVMAGIGAASPFVRDATGRLADRMGIPTTAGQGSGSGLLGRVESALRESPFGGRVRSTDRLAGERAGDVAEGAATTVARGASLPPGVAGRTEVLGAAVTRAAERHATWATNEANTIGELIASTRDGGRVAPVALASLRRSLTDELAQAPAAREAALRPAIAHLDRILADAGNGGLDFRTAMSLRTDLGKIMADTAPGGVNPSVGGPGIDRIYGALREDLLRTAGNADLANQAVAQANGRAAPPSLYARLRAFDDSVSDLRSGGGAQTVLERLAKLAGTDGFQSKVTLDTLLASPQTTRALIAGLERNGEQQAANQLRASIIDEIGRAKAGGQNAEGDVFSFNTFLTNYNKAQKSGALDAIFPDASRVDRLTLNNIAEVAARIKASRAGDNTSHTTGTYATLAGMAGAGSAVDYLLGSKELGAGTVAGAVTGVVLPLVSARMLATPSIARWLSRTLSAAEVGPHVNLGGHLGRLAGMKVEDAATQAELDKLVESIRLDDVLGPLYEQGVKAKPKPNERRSEAEPPPPLPEPGAPPPGLLQTAQAPPMPVPVGMPPGLPPGLLMQDPSAAASAQFAQATQPPSPGIPPGLLTGDPEQILRAMA